MPGPRQHRAIGADAPRDPQLARRLLGQAERHLASAGIDGIDADSRFGMVYDAARTIRNRMEYDAREVTQTEVDELARAAAELVAAARAYVESCA